MCTGVDQETICRRHTFKRRDVDLSGRIAVERCCDVVEVLCLVHKSTVREGLLDPLSDVLYNMTESGVVSGMSQELKLNPLFLYHPIANLSIPPPQLFLLISGMRYGRVALGGRPLPVRVDLL